MGFSHARNSYIAYVIVHGLFGFRDLQHAMIRERYPRAHQRPRHTIGIFDENYIRFCFIVRVVCLFKK